MKVKNIVIKISVFFGFIILLIVPIVMMYQLSQKEMEQYKQNSTYEFKEVAYGKPCEVTRTDIEQYYTFSGSVTSDTFRYTEFQNYNAEQIKTMVNVGDEVRVGDILAYADKKEIKSKYDGMIEEVLSDSQGYIKIRSFDNLKLTCMTDRKIIDKLKDCTNLKLENGNKVSIDFISNVLVDNKEKIVFDIEKSDFMYGQEIQDMKIYTGDVYDNVLVVDKNCVYQKTKSGPYFVRILSDQLVFQREQEVEIGFETDELVTVTNIEEGTMCDSGYKALIEVNDSIDDIAYEE